MESPEQNDVFNAPIDRIGGSGPKESENLQQSSLAEAPFSKTVHPKSQNEAKVSNGSRVIGRLDFDYEKLSENGLKVYNLLLGEIGYNQHLPELAQMEGINLEEGLKELREQELLDESNPNIILITSRKL